MLSMRTVGHRHSLWVALYCSKKQKNPYLSLEVSLVLLVESPESVPVGPLGVGVDVHLDDSVGDGLADLLLGGAGAAVHHQEGGLVLEAWV